MTDFDTRREHTHPSRDDTNHPHGDIMKTPQAFSGVTQCALLIVTSSGATSISPAGPVAPATITLPIASSAPPGSTFSLEEIPMCRSVVSVFRPLFGVALVASFAACARQSAEGDVHAEHAMTPPASPMTSVLARDASLPAAALDVAARLAKSSRHGEWVMIRTGPLDSVKAWVVYPERSTKAPVVVVVHEIYGLSTWVRGVADQLAADGYIAIAPDLLTGKVAPAQGSDTLTQAAASATIRTLQTVDVHRQLAAVGQYGMSLPAAEKKYGMVGFCWGGSTSFMHAVVSPPGLVASVVYYGTSPADSLLR